MVFKIASLSALSFHMPSRSEARKRGSEALHLKAKPTTKKHTQSWSIGKENNLRLLYIFRGYIYIYVYITENSKYWICCKLFGFFKGHEQTNILERGWAKYCFFASPYGVMPFLGLEPDSPVTAFPLDLLFLLSFLVLIAGVVVS